VDIWYLHAKTTPEDVSDGLIEAQQIAKKAGKIRFAGVSTHSGQKELIPFLAKNPNVDVILTQYNFSMEPFMNEVIDEAAKAGKGVVAMKIMAGGFRRPQPGNLTQEKLKRDGAMLAALKWVVRNPNVHTTVPSLTPRPMKRCWRCSWITSGRCTAGCAASAPGNAARDCRWQMCCASSPTPMATGSSHWGASDSSDWTPRTLRSAAANVPGVRFNVPTACMWPNGSSAHRIYSHVEAGLRDRLVCRDFGGSQSRL
jgi:hypothetical protein